ncbi:unnamed protein product [Litomosoides sigmodontis]|uniref:Uncharacterized protein n=1 Tax=Litomosoides sigmodontis TaxID=42156 RepID=A0A3P6TWY9_LITSI|nr:unnamed protein product [Litomosoides sigmodontis]
MSPSILFQPLNVMVDAEVPDMEWKKKMTLERTIPHLRIDDRYTHYASPLGPAWKCKCACVQIVQVSA